MSEGRLEEAPEEETIKIKLLVKYSPVEESSLQSYMKEADADTGVF